MEKTGIEAGISMNEKITKFGIDRFSIQVALELFILFDPSVFAYPQEDDPVDDTLNR